MLTFRPPLNIYVVWHPSFSRGNDYATYLYTEFCRDYQKPFNRSLAIPVFFRAEADDNGRPLPIDFTLADRNAIIVLIDDEMFESDVWTQYFKDIAGDAASNKRIFPVALSKYAYDVAPDVKEQFIRLQTLTDNDEAAAFEKRCKKLRSELLHDLSRLFLNANAQIPGDLETAPPPVKLFISHAKKDGEMMAIDFRNYIRAQTKLSSFFDTNDIANGYDFEKEIAEGVKNSALIVFQTDAYSTREWCRIEIITAKRYKSPMVVVNAIESGEQRGFPYIGNVPTIRWNHNFDDIIDLALAQMLYNLYTEQVLIKYKDLYGLDKGYETAYLTSAPELFNYLDIKKIKKDPAKDILVLYPDPPLGHEELRLMNELDDTLTFITPVMLPNKL